MAGRIGFIQHLQGNLVYAVWGAEQGDLGLVRHEVMTNTATPDEVLQLLAGVRHVPGGPPGERVGA